MTRKLKRWHLSGVPADRRAWNRAGTPTEQRLGRELDANEQRLTQQWLDDRARRQQREKQK